ncbi:MAG: UDP-glucose/GDP-mannose dehydrogenase family protein [Simkaniaceae bacterium]|nr:UDP-glucose/GDP-mannose dehydrogenase family protein [Candidatus Sacchlamyda saccharinae]
MKSLLHFLLLLIAPFSLHCEHKITVIGTGYVGLVSGACLAEFGNDVICCDIDANKIRMLNNGEIPIYEPGLKELVQKNTQIKFSSNVAEAIQKNDVILICVGTPMAQTGEADLTALYSAAKSIGENLNSPKTIYIKSTVPLGTIKKVKSEIGKHNKKDTPFSIAYLPEFLREGSAVQDFLHPDRVVIGAESDEIQNQVLEILQPLQQQNVPFQFTKIESAEAIKLVANSFLAVKISFINEIANLCDQTGADIFEVAQGIGSDSRIGRKCLNPGPGYGGSCFPKDIQAILNNAQDLGVELRVISAAAKANHDQPKVVIEKLKNTLQSPLKGKTIGILGLAFKANTDDVRDSPALKVMEQLLAMGAKIQAYDPEAMLNTKKLFPQVTYCYSTYETAKKADAILVLTEWEEFGRLNWVKIHQLMNHPNIVDARNTLSVNNLTGLGFNLRNIGHCSTPAILKKISQRNTKDSK